ncbi:MAG: Trigger factor [Parcubacteria group bacterium]|nr:Trigger factor [Parcubacteria group bacterium]
MSKNFTDIKTATLPNSEAEITGAITLEFLQSCRTEAIKELNNRIDIPGFRKGHIPESMLIKQVGETAILEEAAEVALGREFPALMKEANIRSIGRPTITITKLAPGVPLEFKITTAVEPAFDLPDYKKIAKDTGDVLDEEITDKEVADVVEEINKREMKPDLKEGETLEAKIRESLAHEKKFRAKEKKRLSIIEKLVNETKIDVPKVLIDSELEKMMLGFKDDVARAGIKWDEYLKSIKKAEDDIQAEWKDKANERAKAELIVIKIAEAEKIEPSAEEVEHEATHMLAHYPDSDPFRLRVYVYTQMRNEKVFEFLENVK